MAVWNRREQDRSTFSRKYNSIRLDSSQTQCFWVFCNIRRHPGVFTILNNLRNSHFFVLKLSLECNTSQLIWKGHGTGYWEQTQAGTQFNVTIGEISAIVIQFQLTSKWTSLFQAKRQNFVIVSFKIKQCQHKQWESQPTRDQLSELLFQPVQKFHIGTPWQPLWEKLGN